MMTRFDVPLGGILRIPVSTYNSSGASVTLTGLSVEDVRIFKDGALEERGPDSGYTVFTDFDARTGLHIIEVDTSQNDSPSGFWADGSEYNVAVDAVTVDSQTVRFWAAWFRLVAVTDVSDVHSLLTLVRSDTAVIETVTSDIQSDTNVLLTRVGEGDWSDILSRLTVTNSLATKVYSDTTTIQSDVTTLASDLAEGDFSDILSRLTVTNSQVLIVKSDTSDIKSHLTVLAANISDINSDTNVLITITSDIQSDTNKLVSDATEVDTSDIQSLLTKVYSDTTAIEGVAGGGLSAAQDSKLTRINSDVISHAAIISDIQSDTNKLVSDATEVDTSDIQSLLTKVYSDTTHIDSDQASQFTVINAIISDIQSDTNILLTRVGEGDWSDILSRLTVTNSDTARIESKAVQIYSDTTKIDTQTLDIQSETEVIQSQVLIVKSDTSDIRSALTIIASDTAVIEAADNVWDEAIDGAVTARQLMRLYASALGGKASGLGTTTAIYRDLADSKDRITATVDGDGNRTAVTRDMT
jgi:hypothetical protein